MKEYCIISQLLLSAIFCFSFSSLTTSYKESLENNIHQTRFPKFVYVDQHLTLNLLFLFKRLVAFSSYYIYLN